ncbi:MAG: glycoside hydrolase family 15 protein [Pseudomonadota bacterium]
MPRTARAPFACEAHIVSWRPFDPRPYPPIGDYGLISDCESIALVGCNGSIDWCCMPQMDADSSFGRLLDWAKGGHCSIAPSDGPVRVQRSYVDGSAVLRTCFEAAGGRVEMHDFFAMNGHPRQPDGSDHLARVVRCTGGHMALRVEVAPRFDFGAIEPDLRAVGLGLYTACGSNKGLLIHCNAPLAVDRAGGRLFRELALSQGEVLELSIRFVRPEALPLAARRWRPEDGQLQRRLEQTLHWWTTWEREGLRAAHPDAHTRRSAVTLKALCFERTGAIAAAATTSLPESPGGVRNWDYRFSWLRDSVLAVRALHALGFVREADRFRAFIERSAAGNAGQLQLMYGVDGRRRLTEVALDHLEGWRGARPVRVGNAAARQNQLDIYGSLLELAWLSHADEPIDPSYWEFLVDAVDIACSRWREPDHGIWEMRDAPRHFVHSKAMCWVAADRGLRLAQRHGLPAPAPRWQAAQAEIRQAIDRHGYDAGRGVFVQAFGEPHPDASLLLLPQFGYLRHDDPRMVRTADWIRQELERGGLLLRYDRPDGLRDPEGAFLPCSFWLAECLAGQGRRAEALRWYGRACACANDLGLFPEEFAHDGSGMLGNFPQLLTHLSQVTARLAIDGP